jgi:2,6-dihydroxypyridine 3-monooxygenase
VTYPIPSGPGERTARVLTNWLWYRNIAEGADLDDVMTDRDGVRREVSLAPGRVCERHVERLRDDAGRHLPPPLVEVVHATRQPFLQAVFDIGVSRMATTRACLIGDAAFAARPHAAAGSAKAAEDGYQLARALEHAAGDVPVALERWQRRQLELGASLLLRAREAGNRAQFDGTWQIGDPLPFGLYAAGDSTMAGP